LSFLLFNIFIPGKDRLFSLRKLTEDFLTDLQEGFPATLSTVFRTGDKLQVSLGTFRKALD